MRTEGLDYLVLLAKIFWGDYHIPAVTAVTTYIAKLLAGIILNFNGRLACEISSHHNTIIQRMTDRKQIIATLVVTVSLLLLI